MVKTKARPKGYILKKEMNEQEKDKTGKSENLPGQTDEIGQQLENENEVNSAIEQQGDDAAAGIPRDTDAAKHEKETDEPEDDNRELTGAP
ncbi:hypothetical protein SAMN05216464_115143 [Mucilaginibacter pineti]|uniref:Uncharacterized protein n=1 Tax=Mucilaginibacter pineti TaxID=1391627 RepID=A0A1G7JWT2_9SPHI|nr:hypothetical protein [Mucilaginibacter pineti]SDF29400.1 hypothetical protein SAMN05216464_115143 [Mucilaginibacter pineti]